MTTALTATICLDADNRAVARVHRYNPTPDMMRLLDRQGCDIAALRIGPLTLQWDDPAHAEAFLADALESLRAERERYARAGAA